ncbi:hypothetical protein HU200_005607 [Digitaria exilis]|uniref:Uncharacterized protein n=1 Tax=Digitaria exilis TaxID=1010633 RepID=A0A835FT31_9POAL|nr:hypothetical protein HU200_005607 [Digitaria exilis]
MSPCYRLLPHGAVYHISTICEYTPDGTLLCGIEPELPTIISFPYSQRRFFLTSVQLGQSMSFEEAAFHAVCYLQSIYGFVVMDYSFQGLLQYER